MRRETLEGLSVVDRNDCWDGVLNELNCETDSSRLTALVLNNQGGYVGDVLYAIFCGGAIFESLHLPVRASIFEVDDIAALVNFAQLCYYTIGTAVL